MRRRIYFHGYLRELVGAEPYEIEAEDVASAIEGLTRQLPQLKPNPQTGRHRVSVVGCPRYEDLKRTGMEEIHIAPQLSGGKSGGIFQILVGAVLIGASFIPGLAPISGALLGAGIGMVVGGVLSYLMPVPKRDVAEGDPEASKYLGSPNNTVAIGTRVPLLYGEDRAYGHFLSFNIDAKDVAV